MKVPNISNNSYPIMFDFWTHLLTLKLDVINPNTSITNLFKILTQSLQSDLEFTDEYRVSLLTHLIGPHSKEKFYQVVNKMM